MRLSHATTVIVLLASTSAGARPAPEDQPLPVREGRPAVAAIGEGAILLDELVMQLDPPVDRARLLQGRATAHELDVLDRLIISRLIAQEGAVMGLGDLPEIRKQVDVFSRESLREVLLASVAGGIEPDEAGVEAAYRDLVREWRTTSLLFTSEAAALAAQKALEGGAGFDTVAERAVADQAAKASSDTEYHRQREFLPDIAAAVARLNAGQVSPIIRLHAGFVLVKVVDIRYPEDPKARDEARQAVRDRLRQEAVRAYEQGLRDKHVVVKQEVLDSLDYEKADVETLRKDSRVLAEIAGAAALTVGDLTDYMRMQSFHGTEQSGLGRRLNARKVGSLETLIIRRLLNAEAARQDIEHANPYLDRVNAFEESLVFGAFVEKVVAPDSKLREEEVRAEYERRRAEFQVPGMLKIRGLAFSERAAAEGATEKLRGGTDYGWLASTAEHQVAADTPGVLAFTGRPVTTGSMPEPLRKALADARAGDVRFYASQEGHYYALNVLEVVEPGTRPYEEVRTQIATALHGAKLKKGVEDYAAKLRALAKIEVYLKKAD